MVVSLEKVDALFGNPVNEPVLLRDMSRPASGKCVSERSGLTGYPEGVAQYRFNQVQHSDCCISVGLDPIAKILPELRLENSEPFTFLCHRGFRGAIQLLSRPFPYPGPPASAQTTAQPVELPHGQRVTVFQFLQATQKGRTLRRCSP